MNKKATSILLMVGEILAVISVIYMMLGYAEYLAKSDTVTKINTANNFMSMINTLVGTPNEGTVAFPYDLSKFTLILNSESVVVFKKGETELEYTTRKFILPEGYTAEGVVQEKATACLEKKNKKILLRDCGDAN